MVQLRQRDSAWNRTLTGVCGRREVALPLPGSAPPGLEPRLPHKRIRPTDAGHSRWIQGELGNPADRGKNGEGVRWVVTAGIRAL